MGKLSCSLTLRIESYTSQDFAGLLWKLGVRLREGVKRRVAVMTGNTVEKLCAIHGNKHHGIVLLGLDYFLLANRLP